MGVTFATFHIVIAPFIGYHICEAISNFCGSTTKQRIFEKSAEQLREGSSHRDVVGGAAGGDAESRVTWLARTRTFSMV